MKFNAIELIGGFINEKMVTNTDLILDSSIYTSNVGLVKQKIEIGYINYIEFFNKEKVKEENSSMSNFYDIIINDIGNNIQLYNSGIISDRLKQLFGQNLEKADKELYTKLNEIIQNMKDGKANSEDTDTKTFVEFITTTIKKEDIKSKSSNEILKSSIIRNGNKFYKLNFLKKFSKKFNIINDSFASELKRLKIDTISNLYTNKRNDYIGVLLKIVPFLKTIYNKKTIDIFTNLNTNKYIIYFKLDDLLYKLYENLDAPDEPIINYCIDSTYTISQIDSPLEPGKVFDKTLVRINHITSHPDLKNILLTNKNFEQIKKSLEFIFKHFKNDPDIISLCDYMFTDIISEIIPKNKLVTNILNLFVLTGNLTLAYKLFGTNYSREFYSAETILDDLLKSGSNSKNPDYTLTISQLNIKDLPDKTKKVKSIIDTIEESHLEKILLDKFKEFIKYNSSSSWLDQSDDAFNSLIKGLHNIGYEGIPDKLITKIDTVKNRLLMFLISARNQITKEITETTYQKTIYSTRYSSGIDLVNSYNFYDLLDNCKEFDNKITSFKPGDSISEIENQLGQVNTVILRNKDTTWYFMLLEVVNLIRKVYRAGNKLGYNSIIPFDFASYLIDIFIVFRIKQDSDIPFNMNLLTHKFNGLRESIAQPVDWLTQTIYNNLTENFILYRYGQFARGTSDCAETVILNLINYLIWDDESETLRVDWLPDNTIQSLKDFYIKYTNFKLLDNPIVRSKLNEIFYSFNFTLQNTDYANENNYKVYSVPKITQSFTEIDDISDAITFYIFDEAGNLLPGKEAISYSGYRIRPGYISFIRLFNIIFGFDKISDKYNENQVMRNVNMESFKEILLTFKNPRITDILSDYTINVSFNKPWDMTSPTDEVYISFEKITVNLEWQHGIVEIKGLTETDSNDNWIRMLDDSNLRYYIDQDYKPIDMESIESNQLSMLLTNTEKLRTAIEERFNECLQKNKPILDTVISVYKTIWAPEQKYLILNNLPNDKYFDSVPMSDNNFFNAFKGEIRLSDDIFSSSINSMSVPIMNMIIELNNNDINKELDKYGNKLIHILVKNELFDLFKIALDKSANYKLTDLFGNNIIHVCKYNKSSTNIKFKLENIQRILELKTGNNLAFNELLMSKNKSGYYPLINLLKKADLIHPIFINRMLYPQSENELLNLFINGVAKLFEHSQKKFIVIFERVLKIMTNKKYKSNLIKMIRFVINLGLKNKLNIVKYIEIIADTKILNSDEIDYLNKINKYQLRTPDTQVLREELIIPTLEISQYYNFNPWVLFNDFNTNPIKLNKIIEVLETNKYLEYFNQLGQIEDIRKGGLIDEITSWISREKKFSENVDRFGNTLYHYLAIGSRINLDKSSSYLKVFNILIKNNKFNLLTIKNKKGWTPIDILSYIPCYPNKVFLEKLGEIRDLFKILIEFYTNFSGDMHDHKIILTRYLIQLYYVNIKQRVIKHIYTIKNKIKTRVKSDDTTLTKNLKEVDDLITLLNSKLSIYPVSTADMLCRTNKDFNLHEYLREFGKTAKISRDYILLNNSFRTFYYEEINGVKQTTMPAIDKLFELSNKTTLNYIPKSSIKCIPELTEKQFARLGDFHSQLNTDINIFSKDVMGTVSDETSDNPADDPADKPAVKQNNDYILPDIGMEDLDNSDYTRVPAINTLNKYLVHDKDYAKLYLKYKQKYINLKNKLNLIN